MTNIAIKVDNLGKQYRLGQVGTGTLTHDLNRLWYRMRGKEDPYLKIGEENDRTKKAISDFVWVLRNISFEVKQGEVLGIIGKNGAGKSTLLKILSQITSPTLGEIKIKGRIAALLEVGTGFHPDLTGRENIFLNGAILGMTKAEIKHKLDEIIYFSGVEKYIDTPVKRYSSGMIVRLGFAIAAHLEPEILVVDEVLAVGDAEFQKKCLGKIKDVSGEGRTVLFVSHNMGQISSLCSRAIILNKGTVEFDGPVDQGVKIYHNIQSTSVIQHYRAPAQPNKSVYITEALLKNSADEAVQTYVHDEVIFLHTKFSASLVLDNILLSISIQDRNDTKIFTTEKSISSVISAKKKQGEAIIRIPDNFLVPGDYKVKAGIHIPNMQVFDSVENICSFTIVDNGSEFSKYEGANTGYVFSKCEWTLK